MWPFRWHGPHVLCERVQQAAPAAAPATCPLRIATCANSIGGVRGDRRKLRRLHASARTLQRPHKPELYQRPGDPDLVMI